MDPQVIYGEKIGQKWLLGLEFSVVITYIGQIVSLSHSV